MNHRSLRKPGLLKRLFKMMDTKCIAVPNGMIFYFINGKTFGQNRIAEFLNAFVIQNNSRSITNGQMAREAPLLQCNSHFRQGGFLVILGKQMWQYMVNTLWVIKS